jgi:hypothetical protein
MSKTNPQIYYTCISIYLGFDQDNGRKVDSTYIQNHNRAGDVIRSLEEIPANSKWVNYQFFITEVHDYGVYQKSITLEGMFDKAQEELVNKRSNYFPVVSGGDKEVA